MAFPRSALSILLASPPSLRSEVFRHVFAIGLTRAFAATTLPVSDYGRHSSVKIHKYPGRLTPRVHIAPGRYASTAASSDTPPLSDARQPSAATPEPTPRLPRLRRFLLTATLVSLFFAGGFAMAAAPAVEAVSDLVNGPSDAETLDLYEPQTPTAEEINAHIVNHPLAQRLRQDASYTESRPHMKIPVANRPHNLMAGALIGENRIGVPPLAFNQKETPLPKMFQIYYVGSDLCGHPGIVHGGLLATLLDEGLARTCFPALPNKIAVTASLNINYRVPVLGNQYLVLRAETTKVEGRKAWAKGWIEVLGDDGQEGVKLVEAEALFIEPKQAKQMARLYGHTAS